MTISWRATTPSGRLRRLHASRDDLVQPDLPGVRRDHTIAYFSAEFGLHESLPIYSGGLGILSGDHCKEASDLGLPFVGVGFLYPQGYFRQRINAQGRAGGHLREAALLAGAGAARHWTPTGTR